LTELIGTEKKNGMTKPACSIACLLALNWGVLAGDYTLHTFTTVQLSQEFWSEGANVGDFNRDGKMDVVSGPYWYEGPDFAKRHEYYPATKSFRVKLEGGTERVVAGYQGALSKNNDYSDNFFAFTYDLNSDGWTDILILGFPSKASYWFENPKGKEGPWPAHLAVDYTDNESPTFADLTGDGKPEIIFHTRIQEGTNMVSYLGYAEPDWQAPNNKFKFHKISTPGKWHWFNHGYGFGDVNGDGRMDILEKDGWWEQPASLAGDPVWKQHRVAFGTGGAQMYAYDVNGDGRNDVITSLAAHGYGLAWFEQLSERSAAGEIQFREHAFVNKEPKDNAYGVKFSQLHALDLVDMDGDGLKDLVTGKRFWAHGPTGDVEPGAPAVLYWFKLVRSADHQVDFVPYLIHNDSGIGTQVLATDVNGDGLPDVVVGNKKGTFVHFHSAKKVPQEQWEQAQPKRVGTLRAAADR
jgi:hypothetical protein